MPPKRKIVEPSEASFVECVTASRAVHASADRPRRDVLFVALAMVLATLVRFDFMQATQWSIDADEAIVGLMGKHILEGRGIPTFYYGQHYMGSLEAILAAGSFALFGTTPFALSLVPLTFAVLLVPLLYSLASSLGGRFAGRVAALLMAIPPSALIIWSSKARGGFIEVLFIGALALLWAVSWSRAKAGAVRYPCVMGLLLGVGWWVNNQIVYFIVPIALGAAFLLLGQMVRRELSVSRFCILVALGTACFLLGGAPYWIYNVRLGFPSFGMFGLAEGADLVKQREGLFALALPIIFGAVRFWHAQETFPGATAVAYVTYGALLTVVVACFWREIIGAVLLKKPQGSAAVAIVILVLPVSCVIFAISTYGWLYQAPRYLLPMYVSLFASAGIAVACLARWSRIAAAAALVVLLGLNTSSAYLGGRAVAGEPIVFGGERVARDHSELIAALDEMGISYIRTNYWIGYRLAFETGERIIFSMFQEPHQIRIPEYERGLTPEQRESVPMVLVPAEAKLVRRALQAAKIPFSERSAGGYVIVFGIQPPKRSGAVVALSEVLSASAWGSQDAKLAVDGDRSTRWGTGSPQRPGMAFEVRFRRPIELAGIEYDIGRWPHDSPRGLQVELLHADGSRHVVLDPEDYAAFRYLYQMNGGFRFDFPAEEAVGVILTQTGKDGRMDWSIGELQFVGVAHGAE